MQASESVVRRKRRNTHAHRTDDLSRPQETRRSWKLQKELDGSPLHVPFEEWWDFVGFSHGWVVGACHHQPCLALL